MRMVKCEGIPGPAKYVLPPMIGCKDVDLRKPKAPCYTIGQRFKHSVPYNGPSPANYKVENCTRFGLNKPTGYIGHRLKNSTAYVTPAPNAYVLPQSLQSPKYSIAHRLKNQVYTRSPAPNIYSVRDSFAYQSAPSYSMRPRLKNPDPLESPGPAKYHPVSRNHCKIHISMKARLPDRKGTNTPAPNAYNLQMHRPGKRGPSYSMGRRWNPAKCVWLDQYFGKLILRQTYNLVNKSSLCTWKMRLIDRCSSSVAPLTSEQLITIDLRAQRIDEKRQRDTFIVRAFISSRRFFVWSPTDFIDCFDALCKYSWCRFGSRVFIKSEHFSYRGICHHKTQMLVTLLAAKTNEETQIWGENRLHNFIFFSFPPSFDQTTTKYLFNAFHKTKIETLNEMKCAGNLFESLFVVPTKQNKTKTSVEKRKTKTAVSLLSLGFYLYNAFFAFIYKEPKIEP